jgi:hypothetical protein
MEWTVASLFGADTALDDDATHLRAPHANPVGPCLCRSQQRYVPHYLEVPSTRHRHLHQPKVYYKFQGRRRQKYYRDNRLPQYSLVHITCSF